MHIHGCSSAASEHQAKKAKKEKAKKEKSASQVTDVGSAMPTIQEEVVAANYVG